MMEITDNALIALSFCCSAHIDMFDLHSTPLDEFLASYRNGENHSATHEFGEIVVIHVLAL